MWSLNYYIADSYLVRQQMRLANDETADGRVFADLISSESLFCPPQPSHCPEYSFSRKGEKVQLCEFHHHEAPASLID